MDIGNILVLVVVGMSAIIWLFFKIRNALPDPIDREYNRIMKKEKKKKQKEEEEENEKFHRFGQEFKCESCGREGHPKQIAWDGDIAIDWDWNTPDDRTRCKDCERLLCGLCKGSLNELCNRCLKKKYIERYHKN